MNNETNEGVHFGGLITVYNKRDPEVCNEILTDGVMTDFPPMELIKDFIREYFPQQNSVRDDTVLPCLIGIAWSLTTELNAGDITEEVWDMELRCIGGAISSIFKYPFWMCEAAYDPKVSNDVSFKVTEITEKEFLDQHASFEDSTL